MSRTQGLRRAPKDDDVVVAFAPRRNLHQLNRARAPIANGLDPRAGPPLVQIFEILKIALLARALHQAEALRGLGGERRYLQFSGIRELAENMLAGFRGDLQPVGVVDLGSIIVETATV